MGIIKTVKQKLLRRRDPVRYWRERGATIGENCEIYSSASFGSEPYLIHVGNYVRINNGVELVTHDGGIWVLRNLGVAPDGDILKGIRIGNNVHIGTNAIVMPGVTIGDNCIIGCGAIVTKDIPDNSIAVGVPARVIESVEEYYEKNKRYISDTKHMTSEEKRAYLLSRQTTGNDE